MALTNAERQARYRKRLQERASLGGLGGQAREACDRAIAAIWTHCKRLGSGEIDGFADLADYRATFVNQKHGGDTLAWACREFLRFDDLTPEEREAMQVVVDLDDALNLRHEVGA